MESFQLLDAASDEDARRLLTRCCGSTRWVERMLLHRPFGRNERLLGLAREEWDSLSREDWLEAFTHHPRIGDRDALRERFATTRDLSAREQSRVDAATDAVLDALAMSNREYEERFGYIFIVCATGKTADEMLALLRERLRNAPDVEIRIAAGEQAKITELRLAVLSS